VTRAAFFILMRGAAVWWLIGAALPAAETEATEAGILFQLRCRQGSLVEKESPRCLRLDVKSGSYEPVENKSVFGGAGVCEMTLPPGTYRFEVLAADAKKNQIVAIRADAVEVGPGSTSAVLPEVVKVMPRVVLDGRSLRLSQLAVRSLAPTGEARWTRAGGDAGSGPAIYATPGQVLQLAIIGATDRLSAALWKRWRVTSGGELKLSAADYLLCEIVVDPATPHFSTGTAWMGFPDGTLEFPLRPAHRVVTNRERVRFGYELVMESKGRKLVVEPTATRLEKRTILSIGGALKPRPWAIAGWHDDGKFYPKWSGALADGQGREVRLSQSKIEHRATILGRDGARAPEAGAVLDDVWRKAFDAPEQALECEMSWWWDGPRKHRGPVEGWRKTEAGHFTLQFPSILRDKAENYFAQLERSHAAWRQVSGRKGPRLVGVGWRLNTHNAKAQVGGQTPWMSMPFKGLHEADGPYAYPWFMIHELGHTFGYHHGPQMEAAERAVHELNDRARWRDVDAFADASAR
jgi:hypothetical protein